MIRPGNDAAARGGAIVLALALGVLCAPGMASAQGAEATPSATGHRLSAYCTSNLMVYLSSARTMGGLGGGFGVRDTLDNRFIFQADLSYLTFLGNVAALRLGAGVQGSGVYAPAALLTFSTLLGDRVTFLTPEHPTPVMGPAVSLGVTLAPLRFAFQGTQVSFLQVGAGLGTDLPGLGVSLSVGLMEVGAAF